MIVCALAFAVFIGFAGVNTDLDIYGGAPDHPIAATGQVYKVAAMHGSIRYVTLYEAESLFLTGQAGSWAGAAFAGAFLLWITARGKSDRRG